MREDYLRVTDILKETGLMGRGIEFASDHAMWRGQTVHMAIHYLVKGTLDWKTVDPDIKGYVEAFQDYMEKNIEKVFFSEKRLYDDILKITGRPDLFCLMKDGRYAVIDPKTGAIPKWGGLQMAPYVLLIKVQKDLGIEFEAPYRPARIGLRLCEDGGWTAKEFNDPRDLQIFMAAYSITNWRKNNGVK